MFNTERYLKLDPWVGLILMISDRTYQNLEPTHCTLHALNPLGATATEVVFHTHRSTSEANLLPPLPKELRYSYRRLDPEEYFQTAGQPLVVNDLKVPTDTPAVLKAITQRTGVVFSLDDFEAIAIAQYGTVVLRSKPESLRWVGQLTVRLDPSASTPLPDALRIKSSTSVFRMLSTSANRQADFAYSAQHDFTPFRYDLHALVNSPNGLTGERLAWVLRRITGDPWVFQTSPSAFNCCSQVVNGQPHYRILYAGVPTPRYTPRTDTNSLIVLDLDETRCTALSGRLLLHYS